MIAKALVNGVYKDIEVEEPDKRETIMAKVEALKAELSEYDYIGVKIATKCATYEDYAEKIAYCQELRFKINELEKEL